MLTIGVSSEILHVIKNLQDKRHGRDVVDDGDREKEVEAEKYLGDNAKTNPATISK